MATKHRIKSEDLYRFELISNLQISPNGKTVIYALQRVDKKTEKKYSNLWIVSTDHGTPRQFTFGDQVDHMPRWSPDGKQILFLSNRENEKQFQIYLIPSQGGEAKPLTSMQGEFGSLSWSPDSKYILCQFRKKDKDAIERERNERKKKLGIIQREIDRVFYKFDGYGFLPKERWHIWTINAKTGRGKQLTDGEIHDEEQPSYSSDGKQIVFVSNRASNPDLEPDLIDLFIIPSTGGEIKKVITPLGGKQLPKFSGDDQWIAYIGREGKGNWWKNDNIWIASVDKPEPAINLTAQFDFHVGQSTINDLNGGAAALTHPTWSIENNRLFFHISKHGNTSLFSIDPRVLLHPRPRLAHQVAEGGQRHQLAVGEEVPVLGHAIQLHTEAQCFFRQISVRNIIGLGLGCNSCVFRRWRQIDPTSIALSYDSHQLGVHSPSFTLLANIIKGHGRSAEKAGRAAPVRRAVLRAAASRAHRKTHHRRLLAPIYHRLHPGLFALFLG